MSRLLSDQPKIAIGVAIGVGVVTAGVTVGYWLKHKFEDQPPKKWIRVGEISDMVMYPVKSGGPVRMDSFNCTQMGLEVENVRDRTFMIIKSNGLLVTGRMHPKIVKITPEVGRDCLTLTAPDTPTFTVNFKELQGREATQRVEIWNNPVQTVDCGDAAARWMSRYLLDEDDGMRLVYYPFNESTRDLRVKLTIAAGMKQSDSGALHDETSLMLINAASVDDLNTRLEHKVTPSQFRPNFVVKGAKAYDEDTWKWVKIGNVVTKNLRPCARCAFTNVEPETGTRNKDNQPLLTLREYRKVPEYDQSPLMGIHLGTRTEGVISMGDAVYVGA